MRPSETASLARALDVPVSAIAQTAEHEAEIALIVCDARARIANERCGHARARRS